MGKNTRNSQLGIMFVKKMSTKSISGKVKRLRNPQERTGDLKFLPRKKKTFSGRHRQRWGSPPKQRTEEKLLPPGLEAAQNHKKMVPLAGWVKTAKFRTGEREWDRRRKGESRNVKKQMK